MSRLTTAKRRALQHGSVRRARAGRELVRLVRLLSRSVLFDRELYEVQRGRRFRGSAAAAYDWVVVGSRLGLVAGPLLIPPILAEGRRPGVGPASWWASQVRAAGFPRTTAHPLVDLRWYADRHPGSGDLIGGPLEHYTIQGRFRGARLGPYDPGGTDLVELGRAAVTDAAPAGLDADDASRPTGGSSVTAFVDATTSLRTALDVLPALLDPASRVDVVVVVTGGRTPEARITARALTLRGPGARVIDTQRSASLLMREFERAAAGGAVLVVTEPLTTSPADVGRLVLAVTTPSGPALVQPLVLAPDDTIASAGLAQGPAGLRPLLRGFPEADGVRAGERVIAAVSPQIFAVRGDAPPRAVPDPAPTGVGAVADWLSGGVREAGGTISVLPTAIASLSSRAGGAAAVDPAAVDRSTGRVATSIAYADPGGSGAQRWAVKSPHPAGPRGRSWGDWHFARALAAALERLGHDAAVDPVDSWNRSTAGLDDVTVTLRGLHRYRPDHRRVNLLWIISHPELVGDTELAEFDAVFAASRPWAARRSALGKAVTPLLQCTDAQVFTPDAGRPGTGYPLLFVGNSRSTRRPLVDAAIATGRELAIIGSGWHGRVPDSVIRASYADNAALPALYRSAGVVLNDHWPHMAADGFLSNRLFDLTAAGARWVSDPACDLTEVFPTGRVARDADELERLLAGEPTTFATEAELLIASELVRREHSFDARARALSDAAARVLANR